MQCKAFTVFTSDENLPTEDVQLAFILTLPRNDKVKPTQEGQPYAWEVLNFTRGESAAYTVIWQSSRHLAFVDGDKISREVSNNIEPGQYVELKDDLKWMTHTHLYGDTKKVLTINNTHTSKRFVLGSNVSWDDEEVEFQPYTRLKELSKKEALMTQFPGCLQIYKAGLTRHEPICESLDSKQGLLVQEKNVRSLEIRLMPDRSWWQLHFDENGGISLQSVDDSDFTTITTIKRIIKKTTIRTWKKKRAGASSTGSYQKVDHETEDLGLDVVTDEGGDDWDVLPTERGPNMRIPWRPKVPGPNLQHRNMTSYVGDSSKQSVRVNMHSMKMKHSLKGGDRPSASHTDGHETTSTMDTLRLGTNEVPTHDGSFDHTPDNDSWQDVSSKSSSLGADEPREVLRQHDDVDNRPYPPDFGNQDGRSSRRNSEVNRVYTSLSTSFTNNKDPGQSRPSDASINRAPLDSGSNSGDLSSRGGKKDESVEQFNPESLDQTITSVAEKAGKKSKKTKKTLVHENDRVKEETITVNHTETKTHTLTSTKIVTGSSFNRGSGSDVEESSSSDSDAGGHVGNIDPIKREEGGSNVAESTATHVRATAGSTPRIEPKPSSNKIEVSDPSNPLSTGIPRILGPSGDGLQSLPDRRENGDLSNKPSRGGTRWQEEESGDVNSAVSNQTRHVSITGEDGHPEPATSGNEVSKTVDGTTNSPTTNVEPLVSHATRSTPNPIPTTTLDSLPLSTITPQPSVQTTYSVDQSTTGIVDVDKGSKSQGPKRCESRDSLLSVTEREKAYGIKGLKNGITSLKKGIASSISSLGKSKQTLEHDRPQPDSETETPPPQLVPCDDPHVDSQTSSKLSKRRSLLNLSFRDRTKAGGHSKVSKLLEGSTEVKEVPHDSPGLSLDSSGSRLSSPSEASLQKGDPCTETPHLPTNQHDDSQSSAGGYPPASPNLETTSGVTANVREGGCGGHDSAKQVSLVDSPITNQVSTRHTEVSENEFSDEESRTHTTTEITTETTTVSSGKTLPLGKRPERAENNRAKIKTSTVDSDKSQLLTQVKMASHYRQKVHSSSASGEGEVDSQVDKSEKEQNSGASSTVHVSTRHSIRSISKDTHTNDSKSHSQIAPVPCDDIPISLSIEGKNASSGQNEREEATHIASHTIGVGSHISDDGQHQLSVNGPVAPSANNKDETLAVSHESSLTETHTRSSSSRSSTQQRDVSRSSVFAALQGRQLETSSRIRLAAESPEFDQRITINVDDSRETGASFGGSKAEHVTSTESTSRETVATSHEHIPVTEIGGATSVQIFDQLFTHSSNTTFENSNSSERKVSYRGTASNSSHVSTSQGATREVVDLKPLRDALRQAANLIDEQIPFEDVPWGKQVLEVFGTQVIPMLRNFQTNALTWDGYHS